MHDRALTQYMALTDILTARNLPIISKIDCLIDLNFSRKAVEGTDLIWWQASDQSD